MQGTGEGNPGTFIEPKDCPCTGQSNSCSNDVLGWRALCQQRMQLLAWPQGGSGVPSLVGPLWLPPGTDSAREMSSDRYFCFLNNTWLMPGDWSHLTKWTHQQTVLLGPAPVRTTSSPLGMAGSSISKRWVLAHLHLLAVACEGGHRVYEGRPSLEMWLSQSHWGRLAPPLWPPPLNPTFPTCSLNRPSYISRGFFWGPQALALGQWSF